MAQRGSLCLRYFEQLALVLVLQLPSTMSNLHSNLLVSLHQPYCNNDMTTHRRILSSQRRLAHFRSQLVYLILKLHTVLVSNMYTC